MFDHYQNIQISEMRREEILDDLQNLRIAQEIADGDSERLPFYAPVLNALGEALVNAGSNLQARYSDVRDAYDAPGVVRPASSTAK
jgi:hypothetical protein